ncbi:MAG: adenine deaminase [Deltaproteobacteria bacterium]|nr:adenine deaminase [Candidatus Anaeroferrophillus wilburensis]MBN2888571.1 adenine deaminase [Deltaproteobacteria bacterium]
MRPEAISQAVHTALGHEPADLIITNGTLVNVFTAEVIPRTAVAIRGERFVAVGELCAAVRGEQTRVIDADGAYLLPGFVETHTHIANVFRLHDFVRLVLPRGTTTVVTEVTELGNSLGAAGVSWFLEEAGRQPMNILATAPCFSPPFPELETVHPFSLAEYAKLFADQRVVGIGEAYWPRIIDPDERTLALLSLAWQHNLPVQGHSAGARREKLQAFAAAGISSCHEPITAEEALERLRLGLYLMIREGSIRQDLEGVAPIREMINDFRQVSISTDGVTTSRLLTEGHLDVIARKAVALGFSPVTVVQMLTINAAAAFGLRDLGAIAPHFRADLQIVPDLATFSPSLVVAGGRIVAEKGSLQVSLEPYIYPEAAYHSLPLAPVTADTFHYPSTGSEARVRAIRPEIGSMVTHEERVTLPVIDGNIVPDPQHSILKYAIVNRHGRQTISIGFLAGTGIRRGAVASTLNWEAYQPTVYGASEAEMATAFNRLLELQGGIVVVEGQTILAELPLPIGGIYADLPLEEINTREEAIENALKSLGSELDNPFFHYQTLSFTGLPFLRLTDKGLYDVRSRKTLPVILD